MINKKKVILMSHLASYEKRQGTEDFKANEYFRFDYASRKNILNIILVLFFTTICVLIYQVNGLYNEDLIFDMVKLKERLVSSAWFVGFVVVLYYFIGFAIYSIDYNKKN